MVHEGWVYFKSDYTPKKRFPKWNIISQLNLVSRICQLNNRELLYIKRITFYYMLSLSMHELEYIKNRRDNIDVQMYHSQKVDTQIYSKTFSLSLLHIRENPEFYRVVYRGASEVKFLNIIHNLVMVVLKLVDNFKGMVIRWRRKRNVSCGSVVSIRKRL